MSTSLLSLLLLAAVAPEPASEAFALIVANNASYESVLAPLSYADDDGARYHELFSLVTRRLDILTVLDTSSQRLYPATAAVARPPNSAELERSLSGIFSEIRAANDRGVRTVFYFIYVGHGSVGDDGAGAMHLLDRRFTRSDLFRDVIAKSPATMNHLVIDACNSFLLVAKRGGTKDVDAALDAAVDQFVHSESLDRYPNTGIVVSTSRAADVHEWSAFQAGVFSHEVRSALVGGADVDSDGVVSYPEIRAFLGAANNMVADPRARLEPYVRAPKIHAAEPLFDRTRAVGAPRLHVPAQIAGRYYLEDNRGVRFADVNMGPGSAIDFLLLPDRGYYLHGEGGQRRIPPDATAMLDASQIDAEAEPAARRGAEEESFRRFLFATPFSRAFFQGFDSTPTYDPTVRIVRGPGEIPTGRVVALSMGAASVGTIAGAIGFALAANRARDEHAVFAGSEADRDRLADRVSSRATAANVMYGVGASLAIGAVVTWLLWD